MSTKKSKLHEFLLKEGVGTKPEYKNLSSYLTKKVGIKVVAKSDKVQTEQQVVNDCHKLLIKKGWIYRTLFTGGIPTGRGYVTNPAKGIPDCLAFDTNSDRMIWIEFKKSHGGIVSKEQNDWHNLLRAHKCEVYIINSVKLLEEKLNEGI